MKKNTIALKLGTDGFTLVELMVVVAIIGILSSVAIPNYQKFQAKARQSEAKISLSGIQMALSSFGADNGSFTSCLSAAGYIPGGWTNTGGPTANANSNRKTYYSHGIGDTPAGAATCWTGGTVACNTYIASPATTCTVGDAKTWFSATLGISGSAPTVTTAEGAIGQIDFTAVANGKISSSGTIDIWTIDNTGTLLNITSGI